MNTAQASNRSLTDFLTYCRGQVQFWHWFPVQGLVLSPTGKTTSKRDLQVLVGWRRGRCERLQKAGLFLEPSAFRSIFNQRPVICDKSKNRTQQPPNKTGKNLDMTQTTSSATDLSQHMVAAG